MKTFPTLSFSTITVNAYRFFDLFGSQSVSMEREEFLKLVKKEVKNLICLAFLIFLSFTFFRVNLYFPKIM